MAGMKKTKKPVTIEYLDESTMVDRTAFSYYLGIDPSYSSSGIVLLPQDANKIEPLIACTIKAGSPGEAFIERMKALLMQLESIVAAYPSESVLVVLEGAAFASEFGAFKLGKLAGVLEYWLATHNYTYYLVAPTYVKKVACNNGAATKIQVINGVRNRWGFKNKSNDINDAYVMARIAQGALPETKKSKSKNERKKK